MTSGHFTSWQIDREKMERVTDFLFSWAPKSLQMVTAAMKLKRTYSWKRSYGTLTQHIKKTETFLC